LRTAGLDRGRAVVGVDGQDVIEARKGQHDPAAMRQGPAREAGPGTAGDHRHPVCGTQAQDGLHLLDALRNHYRHGQLSIRGQGVTLVDAQGLHLGDHGLRRQYTA
jgi:hypothetical protein